MTTHNVEHVMSDAEGVDKFARAMKRKMARKSREGRSGWNDPDDCSAEYLAELLAYELTADDGQPDPVNIGNYAMMLYHRGAAGKRALREVCKTLCAAMDVD